MAQHNLTLTETSEGQTGDDYDKNGHTFITEDVGKPREHRLECSCGAKTDWLKHVDS